MIDVGAVNVVYAATGPLGAGTNQFLHQDTPGVVGTDEAVDIFGGTLAAGDLNGRGIDDLAIGVPGEDIGAVTEAGAVNVLYGRAGGLSGASSVLISQDTPGVGGTAEQSDIFGAALSAADFDGTGAADLAIGVPDESVGTVVEAGALHALRRTDGPLDPATSQLLTENVTTGHPDAAGVYDRFGYTLPQSAYWAQPPAPRVAVVGDRW